MKHLFGAEGEAALRAALRSRPLIAFDFDGTLAPIVPTPADARVAAEIAERLARLAARTPLAVISGRRVDDLRERLGFLPRYVLGNHGAEDPSADDPGLHARALDGARAALAAHDLALKTAGVQIEDKGASIALHYRLAADPGEALAQVMKLVGPLAPGVAIIGGKMVVNLMGADAPDKAAALETLVERSGATGAVFVGDDLNDEPVFARREPSWLTIRIGRDPTSQATYCLEDTAEVAALLDRMLAQLPPVAIAENIAEEKKA